MIVQMGVDMCWEVAQWPHIGCFDSHAGPPVLASGSGTKVCGLVEIPVALGDSELAGDLRGLVAGGVDDCGGMDWIL